MEELSEFTKDVFGFKHEFYIEINENMFYDPMKESNIKIIVGWVLTSFLLFLNENKIENAKKALNKMHLSKGSFEESFNEVLEVQQEALKELECVICLDVPKEDVLSCTEHHILCLGCKQKGLLKCPICRQDFAIYPPTRNRVAKRMIQKLN